MAGNTDPTQEKFWRIKSLKCYPQVYKMLLAGKPAPAIALFIQDIDVQIRSLAAMLGEHRRELLGTGAMMDRMPHVVVSAAREFTDRLLELKRLEDMYDMQKSRLDNAFADELITGKKDPNFSKMEKAVTDTLRLQHQIKLDLNLTGSRSLGTITISQEKMEKIKEKYGDVSDRLLKSPMSRGRMLSAFREVKKLAAMEEGGEGMIVEVKPEPAEEEVPEKKPPKKAVKKRKK